ncbi:MAG: hypothetical protein ACPGVU_17555 [Limisphaerales bacterium]
MNNSPGMSTAAQDALQAAFESEAQSIRQARNRTPKEGEGGRQLASSSGGQGSQDGNMEGLAMGGGGQEPEGMQEGTFGFDDVQVDWGRLPPRVARDLRQSLQEGMSSEFRTQVNAYFKQIAEQSTR